MVPVDGGWGELRLLPNKLHIAKKVLFLRYKRKQLNSGAALISLPPSISCTTHFSVKAQIIVASWGSPVTLHQVHSFNDLYSKVLEQWSPPRDLEVSEVCVQKTQLVAGLETSVGLPRVREGGGRASDR